MADRLTQLQDCMDQLLTQMFACIRYIDTHHTKGSFPDQPDMPVEKDKPDLPDSALSAITPTAPAAPGGPDDSELFQSRLQELASDLMLKEQQIEALIGVLPGVGRSSKAQEERMRELDRDLRAVELERLDAVEERKRLLERVDKVIVGIRRP